MQDVFPEYIFVSLYMLVDPTLLRSGLKLTLAHIHLQHRIRP